ncbi:MAG: VOC family protein [Kofleriaceae bacterium]
MTIVGIDHIQLAIPPGGEVAAREFYIAVMGFTEVEKPAAMYARGGGLWLAAGPVSLHLGIEDGMRPSAKMHPALRVTELDRWASRLLAAGRQWREATDLPGVRRGHTSDPFGNRIELVEVG